MINNRQSFGFNLVELMITLTIFSLLSVIALPSFKSLQQQLRVESNLQTIQQAMQFARNIAITYGTRVTVCPILNNKCGDDWNSGFSVFIDSGKTNQVNTNDVIMLEVSQFHEEDIIQYNRLAVRYQPDGLASGTNGTLTYCPETIDSPYSKAIIVNQAGRVRYSTKNNISCK
ncbi:GspH/FimT family pseudopilin [Shewanella sp. 1_MG-2023]|uniref:GspH/FimT family pseudopilin n=1 Tax=unclassified Shewanella TaxID=196818 RepID=UPI0026E17C54|nr:MULTISPECIES: GspH/FimT family pseudopilin [unclassified Shewanella]MDO6610064.1 GspH/FimT family pseudopilin [Shewanella sp. 7_MG-2023]MDO6769794.1 GspH/FimT family pseudopilin [Shewanella sp. 2_MG-2023]MDO6792858.1 GspH/FimT family pseudopilin [Shewanella sp. 1_MG-2023]